MSRRELEGCYAKLVGLRDAIAFAGPVVSFDVYEDYLLILAQLQKAVDDEFSGFGLNENTTIHGFDEVGRHAFKDPIRSKILQLISYLEKVHNAASRIAEVGSAYNLIRDPELKSRCADLLSAHDHFDRVINQATQVLEERLRRYAPELENEVGKNLVNKAIKNDPQESLLQFSNNKDEQEGYASIFRGIVGAFRNTSHHKFLSSVTREQALQICAFIDNLLSALEAAAERGQG